MILSKRNSSATTNSGYQLFQKASGALSFAFFSVTETLPVACAWITPRINDGLWHLVGVVFTRTGNGVIYVNGAPASGGAGGITSQPGFVSNGVPLRFGLEDQTSSGFFWNGAIDEVRIYNRALSPQELVILYNGGGTSPLSIATSSLPAGTVNVPYPSAALLVSGGTAPYTWTLTSGALPQSLSLSSGGTISGTPTIAGTASFTVQVKDAALNTASQSLNLTINPAAIGITTASLPNGTVNLAYPPRRSPISGGISPYTWSLSSGSFPVGLSLSSSGTLTGTPTTAGSYAFTVQVQTPRFQRRASF